MLAEEQNSEKKFQEIKGPKNKTKKCFFEEGKKSLKKEKKIFNFCL